jgi:hypothetical protein
MNSWFVRIVVLAATLNLIFFSLPSLWVMFGSDVGLSVLVDRGTPLDAALWIHRYSMLSVVVVVIAVFALLSKVRFGNAIAAIVLLVFVMQTTYYRMIDDNPPAEGPLPRLEYDNEEFGRKAEQYARPIGFILEMLLIGSLAGSKRIRRVYVAQYQ